jgi:16S rRNA processing protein RimM
MTPNKDTNEELEFAGTITGTKGFDGRMTLRATPENIMSVRSGAECYIGYSKKFTTKYYVDSWKKTRKEHLLSLKNIVSKEEAINLKEQAVYVNKKDIIQEKKDSYSVGTLLDCIVYDVNTGEKIGKMKDVYLLPANDVWIVNTRKGELPIPFVDEVVKKVDIPNARIEIEMIEGLEELIEGGKDGE